MGQCGCGEIPIDRAFHLPKGQVIGVQLYDGCDYCGNGPGVAVLVFPNRKSVQLEAVAIEQFTPDEDGGNQGLGISIGWFDPEDLVAVAAELECVNGSVGQGDDDYPSIKDWLEDFGLELIQTAMRRFRGRTKGAPIFSGTEPVEGV